MGIIYSGTAGDQYEKWAAEQKALEAAKTVEAEVIEEAVEEPVKKVAAKPAAKK